MAPGDMASATRTPKVSRISRDRTVAYARKQKPAAEGDSGDDTPASESPGNPATASRPATPAQAKGPGAAALPASAPSDPGGVPSEVPAAAAPTAPGDPVGVPSEVPAAALAPRNPNIEPWPDATPTPMKPVDPARVTAPTVTMPVHTSIGEPPAMPRGAAAASAAVADVGSAEAPTRMPGPRELPGGDPGDPASPPGQVPPGDSRSMRRRADRYEFALIYRIQTYVISRFGEVGTRGQWRVVEYPTSASASHAYAKECSRFVSEGFSDYRA